MDIRLGEQWADEAVKGIPQTEKARQKLMSREGAGSEFLGWLDLPQKILESDLLVEIEETAASLAQLGPVFVVVGIGGSYLGARAVIEALQGFWHNQEVLTGRKNGTAVFFSGQNMDSSEMNHILDLVANYDVTLNVISKSGTTTEPGIAFRLLRQKLQDKYGAGYSQRIIATTDAHKGALRRLADENNMKTFAIPDDVGGRYSVFTPVGLLPIAMAGISLRRLLSGAAEMQEHLFTTQGLDNPANRYAAARHYLYHKGKSIELLIQYLQRGFLVAEWWKQLFGESEGKQGFSLWPASAQFTTDLHSLGQWLQDGPRNIFETVLAWEEPEEVHIKEDEQNLDGLNYLAGKSLAHVNRVAREATQKAHVEGGVEQVTLYPGQLNADQLGALLYFFEYSCAVSAYQFGVNPFNQPGVEAYKKNMFRMLGKPGA